MNDSKQSRRLFLTTASIGLVGSLAGCSTITNSDDDTSSENPDQVTEMRRPAYGTGIEANTVQVFYGADSDESNSLVRSSNFTLLDEDFSPRVEFYDYPTSGLGRMAHQVFRAIQDKNTITEYFHAINLTALPDNELSRDWLFELAEEYTISNEELTVILDNNIYEPVIDSDFSQLNSRSPPVVFVNGTEVEPTLDDIQNAL